METHQVRYFLALCEELNFTRAARRCGVSQPSLTNAIKRLEAELGGPLFDRSHAGTRLSDLGILLRPELAAISQAMAQAARKAAQLSSPRPLTPKRKAMGVFMRPRLVIAVAAVAAISFGAKTIFFSSHTAEAGIHAVSSSGMQILQMHIEHPNINNLPVQKLNDMTLVFPDGK